MGSTPLDQLLRQLKPGWKNVQWAKATNLNATHLSRVRTGRVNLSMHVAQQLAGAVAPDDPKEREELVTQFLAVSSDTADNRTSIQQFKDLMARLSHPNTWVCVEYRDLPRASEGGRYEDIAEVVGKAIKAGLCFAMFQPFGSEEGDAHKARHLPPAVRSYLYNVIGEVRAAYAKLAMAAENAGVKEEDVRRRLVLYERMDGTGLTMGFQSRLFCAKLPDRYGPIHEVWEWVAAPGEDLFVRRDIDSKAVSQQFFEVTAFLEKLKQNGEPARLPASGRELAEGRQHAMKMWPDLKPRVIWNVSKVSARVHTAHQSGKGRHGR